MLLSKEVLSLGEVGSSRMCSERSPVRDAGLECEATRGRWGGSDPRPWDASLFQCFTKVTLMRAHRASSKLFLVVKFVTELQ